MANKREGYESVDVGGVDHMFKADFAFLAELKDEAKEDPMRLFASFATGESDPNMVRAVLVSSIVSVDGVALPDNIRQEVIEELITRYGLQEAWILAQHLLSYAMIGSIKKSRLGDLEKMTQSLGGLSWLSLKSLQSRWALPLVIFGASVCISTSLSVLLIWLSMG